MSQREHKTRSRANPGGMDVLKVLGGEVRPLRERKPAWFKVPAPGSARYRELRARIEAENLHTVCQEAACPNIGECWERGTATFMILGDTCTRRCGFCNVKTGKPTWNDPLEPARVARSVARMGLRHAVITSVDRDDLPDYGAGAFVGVIRQIRRQAPDCKVEVLTPDFRGQEMPLAKVIAERPDVFNHNVEVVPRLYPVARRGSRWERSLRVLRNAKAMGGDEVVTKSGLMVGLGETHEEMVEAFGMLREHDVQVLTVGQYLRPTEQHLPVVRYWHPDEFKALEQAAYALGFDHIAAGPLVRSSYHADTHIEQDRPGVGPLAATAWTARCNPSVAPERRWSARLRPRIASAQDWVSGRRYVRAPTGPGTPIGSPHDPHARRAAQRGHRRRRARGARPPPATASPPRAGRPRAPTSPRRSSRSSTPIARSSGSQRARRLTRARRRDHAWKARDMAAYGYLDHDDPAPDARTGRTSASPPAATGRPGGPRTSRSGYATAQAVVDALAGLARAPREHRAPEFRATRRGRRGRRRWPSTGRRPSASTVDAGSARPRRRRDGAGRRRARDADARTRAAAGARREASCACAAHSAAARVACRGRRRARGDRSCASRSIRRGRTFARARMRARLREPSAVRLRPDAPPARRAATRSSSAPARPPPSASGA